MKGSVFKRCPCGITGGGGKRPPACKKKHGAWYYVADLGEDRNGRRRQQKKGGFSTQGEASTALAALVTQVSSGQHNHDERKTLRDYLAEWIEAKVDEGLRPTTERAYRHHIRDYLVPHLGSVRLRDLRPGHVSAMLRKIRNVDGAPAPATVRRIHATLRSALASAMRDQLVPHNAARTVALPSAPRPKVRPWEPNELGAFLDSVAADRLSALFELVAATGLRRGEACGLRWEDVDLAAGEVVVRQQIVEVSGLHPCPYCEAGHRGLCFGPPKTSSGEARTVELDQGTIGALLAHKLSQDAEREDWGEAYADHGLVFARGDGNPLAPTNAVTKRFVELVKAAGLRQVRLHDLRHGAASLRLAAGIDISVISKVLGHSSVAITSDTYSHLLKGVGRAAAEKANAQVPRRRSADKIKNRGDQSVTTEANPQVSGPAVADVLPGESGGPPGTRTPNLWIKSEPSAMPGGAA